jgi:hypothetical protein
LNCGSADSKVGEIAGRLGATAAVENSYSEPPIVGGTN